MRTHRLNCHPTPRAYARALAPAVALLLSLGACLVSVAPVIPDADATFDARLLGSWEEVDGGARATLTRGGSNDYVIEYSEDGAVARYEARLGTLAGRLVLDVWAEPRDGEIPKQYADMLLPVHLAFVITIAGDQVRLSMIDADDVARSLSEARSPVAHSRVSGRTALLGTTAEVRTALADHLARGGAIESPGVFRRLKGE